MREPQAIAVYVSGHGYGHATRTAAVIRSLLAASPQLRVSVRTQAPAALFPADILYDRAEIDAEIVESSDAVVIDTAATRRSLSALLGRADEIISCETAWVEENAPNLIVADIPFLAGHIAYETGVPAIAMGNFTWDWIYQPILGDQPDALEFIRTGYRRFQRALRFPLTQPDGWDVFPAVTDVPLVTQRSQRRVDEILRSRGLEEDGRIRVLFGGRGRVDPSAFEKASVDGPEFLFLCRETDYGGRARNVRPLRFGADISFSDALRISDIVVSKLGYSLAAECIAERKRLLYPPRSGFREDTFLAREAKRHIAMLEMAPEDFSAGEWVGALRELLIQRMPDSDLGLNGADVCAEVIRSMLVDI
jgi:L-arabinokinase